MKISISVDIGEGPTTVTTSFMNVIEWERKYKRRAGDLAQGVGAEDLAFLSWVASKSAGLTVPMMFDDFAKKIIALEVVSEEDINPTPEGHTAAG